jgi:hypothetical protein
MSAAKFGKLVAGKVDLAAAHKRLLLLILDHGTLWDVKKKIHPLFQIITLNK